MAQKKQKMYLNVLHKTQKVDGNFDLFLFQQDISHKVGLKTTIMVPYSAMFDDKIIETIKQHNTEYGDEIGLLIEHFQCEEFQKKLKNDEFSFWLYSQADKKKIIKLLFEKFNRLFGCYPKSIASYVMDTFSVNYIKQNYPAVKAAITTCFEEGVRVYHGNDHCWYLFSEGGPWWPWFSSKHNVMCPAANKSEDAGIVSLPHLVRDLAVCINSRDDWFALHPQNVIRAMAYKGDKYPYLYNLIDQNLVQLQYNDGYSYCNIFVGPYWMGKKTLLDAPHKVVIESYTNTLKYFQKLAKQGLVEDMYMTEFADWYRKNAGYEKPCVALWQDKLYGSKKKIFWLINSNYRVTLDAGQAGAIVDFRPYAGKIDRPVGPDTPNLADGSFPYVIQTQYVSSGGDSSERSMFNCRVVYDGQEKQLRDYKADCKYVKKNNCVRLEIEPVPLEFDGLKIELAGSFEFTRDAIKIERRIIKSSKPSAKVEIEEFFNGTLGSTDYTSDLSGIKLEIADKSRKKTIKYGYRNKKHRLDKPKYVRVTIPEIKASITMECRSAADSGSISEGYVSKPMYSLRLSKNIKKGEAFQTWLKVKKNG